MTRAAPIAPELNADPRSDSAGGAIAAGVTAIALFFCGFGAWAAATPLNAGVAASGVVVVSGNRQTVQHRDGGIVERLLVEEGQRVEAEQVLIELAMTELRSQERALLGRLIELEALRARLAAEAAGSQVASAPNHWATLPIEYQAVAADALERQRSEMEARRAALNAQLDVLGQRQNQIEVRITGYEEQISATEREAALIADELASVEDLAERGLVPLPRVRALQREQAALDGRRGELTSSIEQAREAIGEARLQAISLEQDRAQAIAAELRETDTLLADLAPRVDTIQEQIERARIRAPASGSVMGLSIFTEGGVIRPGEAILDIVPEDQPLVLEAQVDPRDADDLTVGQRTEVRITAFGARNMPTVYGEVTRISADRFVDERSARAYFVVEVTVPREEIDRLEAAGASGLRAGLPAEIVIPLRERTALEYLLEPLNQSLWRSFREG
ncbi:MAG: HlyD family type I secretion periplasmic adaptor subunit [Maricaulaceae bacterium]|jgi:HlyD family secretion protein